MLRRSIICSWLVTALCTAVQAVPTYTGSLTSADGGLVGTAGWLDTPDKAVTFSWTVTENADQSWHYRYELNSTGFEGGQGYLILETGDTLQADDFLNVAPVSMDGAPGVHSADEGYASLPEPVFGLKFEPFSPPVALIDFDSPAAPTWGDFYAKSGHFWNAGFTASDTDPIAAADNGSISYHVLVPGVDGSITTGDNGLGPQTSAVPAPGALLLSTFGSVLLSRLRTRRVL